MATVDLEALATELRAAGFAVHRNVSRPEAHGFLIGLTPVSFTFDGVSAHGWVDWEALDIIRRHLAAGAARTEEGG